MDTTGSWYKSTILNTKTEDIIGGKKVLMVQIGYRRYDVNGLKKDTEGNAFFGWSATYDEWINAFSVRIQKGDTIARLGKVACKKTIDDEDKEMKGYIDDYSDILVNNLEGVNQFAILRPEKVKSEIMVNLLNNFGCEGGFTKMLERIEDKSKPAIYGIFINFASQKTMCIIIWM